MKKDKPKTKNEPIAPTAGKRHTPPGWVTYWMAKGVTPARLEKMNKYGRLKALSSAIGIPKDDLYALAYRWGIEVELPVEEEGSKELEELEEPEENE